MRQGLLRQLYRLFPFDLRGDCTGLEAVDREGIRISCIINFYGRIDLLEGILHSLAQQDFPQEHFEVVLVEDRGGSEGGRKVAENFGRMLQIVYRPLDLNFGKMGYSRNFGLAASRGGIILFLDDDTVILQSNFLSLLDQLFTRENVDAVIPRGVASFSLIGDRYDFHDPFFMTSRCMAYRRGVLADLAGFVSDFVGQEDVEYVIRFTMADKEAIKAPQLQYYHPPLLVPNFRKPQAVGSSFYALRERYPLLLWLLVLVNGARHAPLYLLPIRRFREMGRFGIGFFCGVILSIFKKEGFRYN